MEDDLIVLHHYSFFLIRGHKFRGGNHGAAMLVWGTGGNVMGFFIV